MPSFPRIGLSALVLALATTFPASAAGIPRSAASAGPVVDAPAGKFSGITTQGMNAYLGIRYAKPPVGALRWQPPQPFAKPGADVKAKAFGNHCPQIGSAFGQTSLDEDCLFLNVFTPTTLPSNPHLPVMVWIHGGAFTSGESDDYDPDRFVANGAIVVTLNYRLGLLGFLAVPALDRSGRPSVNYGLMDQQAALRWVAANISAFGGDPRRVTIFGESAGGLSVFSQLASPGATGLFSAALIESGSYQLELPTLAASEAAGTQTAEALGCTKDIASCLRAVPVATLLATEASMTVPTVDGTVLPASPGDAFAAGTFNRVPIVDGTNHDEYRLFVAGDFDLGPNGPITPAEYPALIEASLGPTAGAEVVAEYPLANYPSPDVAFATLVTDYIFSCPALGADVALAKRVPLFAYEFSDENAPEPYLPPVSFPYAAAHASELQFIWDSFTRTNPPLTTAEQALGKTMVGYWTQFAALHAPLEQGAPIWFPFFSPFDSIQAFVPPTPGRTYGIAFAADHKCAFWAALASGSSATKATLGDIRSAARRMRR
jgi:para-nitrobenzyl esterase